jgi:D-glycero-D-manno-heptose 1,7-bisphosphate phosphatase
MQKEDFQKLKLIILDRDGVINIDSEHYIRTPEEWHPIPGSIEAIALLTHAGMKVVVATNQSGLGRGYYDLETLNAIHAKMHHTVTAAGGKITEIFYCPHVPDDHCDCRKPKPGLVLQALKATQTQPDEACFVGDSSRDLEAAILANVKPVLVTTGNGAEALEKGILEKIGVFHDLLSFAKMLVKERVEQ